MLFDGAVVAAAPWFATASSALGRGDRGRATLDGVVVGDGARIGPGNELIPGARVWPGVALGETAVRFSSDQ